MTLDYRDFAIAHVCGDEAALLEQLIDMTIERDSYRLLAQVAIHALHEQHVERDREREQHHRLIAEYRAHRERTMREAVAA